MKHETSEEREARLDAAYERGWADSLHAYDARSLQPSEDIYAYVDGWKACAKYRWENPSNDGRAPDPNYRVARGRRK